MIHWVQKIKFDHARKSYMHNTESVRENETHKILWDFEIQTDTLISARRAVLVIVNNNDKKKKKNKKERKKERKEKREPDE